MHKQEFLDGLRARLRGLPEADIAERLAFYSEMIDDRMEEGASEEEAVAKIGSTDEIAAQIIADTPLTRIAKERIKSRRRLKAWEITLLILGSPIWLSLAVAALAVLVSVYVALWSVIVSFWAVFGSFLACAAGGVLGGTVVAVTGHGASGLALIGAGLVLAGLSILWFFGCKAGTQGCAWLTKQIALGVKRLILGKEAAE